MSDAVFVNVADLRDPSDPAGRSYRQVNAAKSHAIPIGALVEMESGARLFVVLHTRDCDETPFYSLSALPPGEDDPLLERQHMHHGYMEDGLTLIRA